ncbi:MAG: hypothetical protein WCO33_05365, partial [bacterium]
IIICSYLTLYSYMNTFKLSVSNFLRNKIVIKSVFVFALLLFTVLLAWSSYWASGNDLTNSDAVAEILLLKEPLSTNNKVFFPDHNYLVKLPFYYLITDLTGFTIKSLHIINFSNYVILFSSFLIFFLYANKYRNKLIIVAYSGYLTVLSLTFSELLSNPSIRNFEYAILFISLILILYLERNIQKSKKIITIILSLITVLLLTSITVGDSLFLYAALVPIFIAVLYVYIYKGDNTDRKNLRLITLLGITAITLIATFGLKYLITKSGLFVITSNDSPTLVSFENIIPNIKFTFDGLLNIYNANVFGKKLLSLETITNILNLFVLLASIFGLIKMLIKGIKENSFIKILIPLFYVFVLFAYMLSDRVANLSTTRYITLLPFLSGFGLLHSVNSLRSKLIIIVLLTLLSVLNIMLWNPIDFQTRSGQIGQFQEIANLIDKSGMQTGYSSYWISGALTYLSNYNINVRPIECTKPFTFISRESWYQKNSSNNTTFIVLDENGVFFDKCSLSDIISKFGEPYQIEKITQLGGTLKLLKFNYDISEKF